MNTPHSSAAEVLERISNGNSPFAIYRHEDNPDEIVIAEGNLSEHFKLDDIPRQSGIPEEGAVIDTISTVPYSQIRERGYEVNNQDNVPIKCLEVTCVTRVSLAEVFDALPQDQIALQDGVRFDKTDEEYAGMVRDIQENEIGNGEGANFVVPRTAEADIVDFNRSKVLSIFRNLLNEGGSYMTFAFSDGENYLIGASPERHLSVKEGVVGMTPISGTFRKTDGSFDREKFLEFLRDPKEQHELFMVLDEEIKMMAQMCMRGGRVYGPMLREMRRVIHTEYEIEGFSDLDIIDLFRRSMYAPTVVGGPIKNAAKINRKYDANDRRNYSGAIVEIGRDEAGTDRLDSAITIRTMEITSNGHATVKAGSTIVQGSVPIEEARETSAKATGALCGLENASGPFVPQLPAAGEDPELEAALEERNRLLSPYFFENFEGQNLTVEELKDKTITVVTSDDDFSYVLAHMLSKMGANVTVVEYEDYSPSDDDANLVVVGPGTGDPNNMNDSKMQRYTEVLTELEKGDRPFAAVCLGHQVLSKVIGLDVEKKDDPTQGIAREIDLFGEQKRVGFYNTFAAKQSKDIVGVEFSTDPETGEVHAMRGEKFVSFQFHPESVLSQHGFDILRDEFVRLISKDDSAIVTATELA